MLMSKEARAEQVDVERQLDDLVRVLKDQNADPCAVARCLRHLAVMLHTLGDPKASLRVRQHLDADDVIRSKPKADPRVSEFSDDNDQSIREC